MPAQQSAALGSPVLLESLPGEALAIPKTGLNLFWRTFFLLALLLTGSILAWLLILREMEFDPRATQTAQQIASLVNLSRAALIHADSIARIPLMKTMTEQEGVRIVPREPGDIFELFNTDALSRKITQELTSRLGTGTVVASQVNRENGLWVGFVIDGDNYWMLTDRTRFNQAAGKTWLIWLSAAAILSLAGAALIAGLINRPLKNLSFAARQVRKGDFSAGRLNEDVSTQEIRQVNMDFNRMAQRLSQIEQERRVMLAGISHDLRTPLSRLRLETEMSVADLDARAHMTADIEQLDVIIDKFLDYARPAPVNLTPVNLDETLRACLFALNDRQDIVVNLDVQEHLTVMADPIELGRVFSNLLENAVRYGKTVQTGIARVDIAARAKDNWILIQVSDHGAGVASENLARLTKPFFRGDSARTAATGAGLGLSIVEKTIQRLGGQFTLANGPAGGLTAHIKLAKSP